MQFQPTDDQKAFRETAKRFATEKLAPTYQERASGHTFDRALIKEMGALGLIGADLPEEFGGLGESVQKGRDGHERGEARGIREAGEDLYSCSWGTKQSNMETAQVS